MVTSLIYGIALTVTACGPAQHYTPDVTRSCLQAQGALVSTRHDHLDGRLSVHLAGNGAMIVFEKSESDAEHTETAYGRVYRHFDVPPASVLDRQRNAVLVWLMPPTEEEQRLVSECLE